MKTLFSILLVSFCLTAQTNVPNTNIWDFNGNTGVGIQQAENIFDIGYSFSFHQGGHYVLGFNDRPGRTGIIDNTKYSAGIRLDPLGGLFRFEVSESTTTSPRTVMSLHNNGNTSFLSNILGSGGETSIKNFKNIIGRTSDGILHLRAGKSDGPVFINYYETGLVSLANGGGKVGIGTADPDATLTIRKDNQRLNFLVNKKLTGSWPAVVENTTMTIQSSGSSAGNIAFATGNSERMRIQSDGDVGIGTTNPLHKLEVVTEAGLPAIVTGNENLIGFKRSDGALVYGMGHVNGEFTIGASPNLGQTAGTTMHIATGGSQTPIRFSLGSNNEVMRLTNNGNVGIGTTTPEGRLDLGRSLGANKGLRVGDYLEMNERETVNNAAVIGFNALIDDGNVANFKPKYYASSSATGMIMAMQSGGVANIDFMGVNWNQSSSSKSVSQFNKVLHLNTNGNVGIGTTSPESKLTVDGTITAKKVRITANIIGGADFVFEDDYDLKTLSETEKFIKENKHLPEIPSAKHMKENGLDMSEFQIKLLQKIEELTLHTIRQQKEIDQLKKKLAKN